MNPKRIRWTPLVALVAVLALAAGCSSSIARFQARVPAQIDVGDIERIAVADFDGLEQTGRMVSAHLTQGLVENGHFRTFERSKLDEILAERDFSHSSHVDPATANRLKLLGVEGLVFGVVDAYSVDDQTGVTRVETTIGSGEYETVQEKDRDGTVREVKKEIQKTVMVDRGYVLRQGMMGVTFRLANVNTGEIVAIKAETVHFSERAWQDEAQKLPPKDVILEGLAARVSQRFLTQIQPQTVVRAVKFEKNDLPQTEVGIKFAKNGLWDQAAGELRSAAMAGPAVASAHYNLGLTYDALGRYLDAQDALEQAIRLEPKDSYITALAQVRRHAQDAAVLQWQETGR